MTRWRRVWKLLKDIEKAAKDDPKALKSIKALRTALEQIEGREKRAR